MKKPDKNKLAKIIDTQPDLKTVTIAPQSSLLYRVIAFFAQMQLGYLCRDGRHSQAAVRAFVFIEALTALAIIAITAYLVQLPLLFPPLGPSAFILFRTPMSRTASPRSVLLAHSLALLIGLIMLQLFVFCYPGVEWQSDTALHWPKIFALSLAMGLTSLAMIQFNCAHPPAAATALIAAMGFFDSWIQIFALPAATILLLIQAQLFNRVLGGLPVPLWYFNAETANRYPDLAGLGDREIPYWEKITEKIQYRRR